MFLSFLRIEFMSFCWDEYNFVLFQICDSLIEHQDKKHGAEYDCLDVSESHVA